MNYKLIKDILRIGIGGMFVIAAILKLMSIDEFEIYIYSFKIKADKLKGNALAPPSAEKHYRKYRNATYGDEADKRQGV